MKRIFLLIMTIFFSVQVLAIQWQELPALLPKGTQVSYYVIDAKNSQPVSSYQKEILRTPASIQKLLTATAAKLYLGGDYQYQTTINANKQLLKNGIYQGDLAFVFSGDPTLSRADIRSMLRQLKASGVNKINGDLLLDNHQFNGYQWSNGQAWNDLGVCYTAPSNAIIINKNCVLGNLSQPNKKANKARLYIPSYEPVAITSDVAVVTKAQREQSFCDLELTRNSQNHYHLWGCMTARNKPLALAFSVNDPVSYAKQIISSELKESGISLTGQVKLAEKTISSELTPLISYRSPNLDELVIEMMKDSDNLIADSLFKTLGARYYQQPGNFRNGAQATKAILREHGIELENAYLADGSGLSRHNLMSASLFMEVMSYVYKHNNSLGLLSSFSIAGVDGTLKYRAGLRNAPFKGNVIAKTGSLKGVANLVGIVKSSEGDKLFVLMINGYNRETSIDSSKQKNSAQQQTVSHFEKAFFNKVLN